MIGVKINRLVQDVVRCAWNKEPSLHYVWDVNRLFMLILVHQHTHLTHVVTWLPKKQSSACESKRFLSTPNNQIFHLICTYHSFILLSNHLTIIDIGQTSIYHMERWAFKLFVRFVQRHWTAVLDT